MINIANFEQYSITESGEVISHRDNQPLTPWVANNGYLQVSLGKSSSNKNIHRLVAMHYLPNPYQYDYVNHKDGDKTNNHVDNLEWCSAAENSNHALRTGLRPGYMSFDDKTKYLHEVIMGKDLGQLASELSRTKESLTKMLRVTSDKLGLRKQWDTTMAERRKDVAIRNLEKANS